MHFTCCFRPYRGSVSDRIWPVWLWSTWCFGRQSRITFLERSPLTKVPVWLNAAHAMLLTPNRKDPRIY